MNAIAVLGQQPILGWKETFITAETPSIDFGE
jgi:hypothetical protein